MKIKGISFFEQHVEKFVLFGALALALFFTAMQFLFPGNVVEMGNETLTASEIDPELVERAQDLQARLDESAPPTVLPPEAPDLAQWFAMRLEGPVTPSDERLAWFPSTPPVFDTGGEIQEYNKQFVVPVLAAAGKPWVDQHADALESREDLPEKVAAAVQFESATNDISWTTPAVMLDLEALRNQLRMSDPTGEKLAIPPSWYDSRIYVLDVVWERERLLDDGSWGETTTVPLLTEELIAHRGRVNGNPMFSRSGMEDLLEWLREEPGLNQASIIQPDFYPTKSSMWLPPEEPREINQNPVMVQIMDMESRLAYLESERDAVLKQLEEYGGPMSEEEMRGGDGRNGDRDRDRGRGTGGGSGPQIPGGGGGGGIGLGGGEDDDRQEQDERDRRIRLRLTHKYLKLVSKINDLRPQLEALAQEHGIDLMPDDGMERDYPDLETDESVMVWGHDPTVERSETYRYRATIKVYNPFFGKGLFLVPEQQPLAEKAALDVQTSDWSSPVKVKPLTRFFVTRARADDSAFGTGSARVEVFRLHDGVWYQREWDLYPGDPVGEVRREEDASGAPVHVDYFTEVFVQDVLRIPDDRGGGALSRATQDRVVFFTSEGEQVVRNPASDTNTAERLRLMTFTEAERRAEAR